MEAAWPSSAPASCPSDAEPSWTALASRHWAPSVEESENIILGRRDATRRRKRSWSSHTVAAAVVVVVV